MLGGYRDIRKKLEETRHQLAAFAAPRPILTSAPTPEITPCSDAQVLVMLHRKVEEWARKATGIPEGTPITRGDAKRMIKLDLSNADLQDISIVAEFVNLVDLL